MRKDQQPLQVVEGLLSRGPAQLINQTSGDVDYFTPPHIVEAARDAMGSIDLDPASNVRANEIVKAGKFYSTGGLLRPWFGNVWMNHPFSRAENHLWITRLVESWCSGAITAACCITYACTSEKWFAPLLDCPQCFLIPRTQYLLPDGSVKRGVTKGSVVTYLGRDVQRFAKAFRGLGSVKIPYPYWEDTP